MRKALYFFLIFSLVPFLYGNEKAGLKVFISVDMEGITGVVHGEQTSLEGREYGPARKWMAEDVNAVILGALEAGATEIVVNDSHGSMRNVIPDDLHPKAFLISGSPKPLSMMQGIDSSFDVCIFVGYHSKAGTAASVLDHTYSGASVYSIKINGLEMPELGLNAVIAGYFDVPVVMLSGDEEVCRQAKSILGSEVVTVAVKESFGRYAAKLVPFDEARRLLKVGAKEAVLKREKIKPFKLNPPYQFEVEFLTSAQAEMAELIPQVKRTSGRGVSFTSKDYIEGFKLMRALIALAPAR